MANNLAILYANGEVQAVQLFIWDGTKPVLWDGGVTFSGSISIATVNQGNAGTQPWLSDLSTVKGVPTSVNSGNKDNGTQRVILATDQPAISIVGPLTNTELRAAPIQNAASNETNTIFNGTTALTPKFAKINTAGAGATQLVAAVSGKKIRVTQVILISQGGVTLKFQSHTTPTDITGPLYLTSNSGFAPGYDPTGHFETLVGEALDINLSTAVAVGGWLKYIEV